MLQNTFQNWKCLMCVMRKKLMQSFLCWLIWSHYFIHLLGFLFIPWIIPQNRGCLSVWHSRNHVESYCCCNKIISSLGCWFKSCSAKKWSCVKYLSNFYLYFFVANIRPSFLVLKTDLKFSYGWGRDRIGAGGKRLPASGAAGEERVFAVAAGNNSSHPIPR